MREDDHSRVEVTLPGGWHGETPGENARQRCAGRKDDRSGVGDSPALRAGELASGVVTVISTVLSVVGTSFCNMLCPLACTTLIPIWFLMLFSSFLKNCENPNRCSESFQTETADQYPLLILISVIG